jgi:putative transcriptional regulator
MSSSKRENLAEKIAGEIILSINPSATLRRWREIFDITQVQTAKCLHVPPSVVSDYECGRRMPGTRFVKKFVEGIMQIDEERGGRIIRELSYLASSVTDAITCIREFQAPFKASRLCQVVNGVPQACKELLDRDIYGYTIVDSIKVIQALSGTDFYQLFGSTTERAAIFTNSSSGRSPLVAVRVHPLKPRMIIIQGPREMDTLAIRLAEVEAIPLVLSKMETASELINALENFYRNNTSK